jgi:murein DD-endopeptidase MepM/ murein hydrolase activator NlpD
MKSPRYTILIANRNTGTVRRFTVSRRPALAVIAGVMAVPVLMGLGARWSARTQLLSLETSNQALRIENDSYRGATGQLTTQITSLQSAIDQLGSEAQIDPAVREAMDKLPSSIRNRGMGGAVGVDPGASTKTPGGFGLIHDLLGVLGSRLESVRTALEHQQALAAATPSLFPVTGGLSSRYGARSDPFSEGREFHPGLDFSADYGEPVHATADGTIETAGWGGDYGNEVMISHGFGITTRYGHMSRIAVRAGDKVHRGDVVGYVGATGRATGPHLHYEVLLYGQTVDPLSFLTKPLG